MASFVEVQFPPGISYGSAGGPERRTDVVTLGSGAEERNAIWAHSRRRYQAGYGVRTLDDFQAVLAFHEARNGRLIAFRWKDWADYRSLGPMTAPTMLDQNIGTGDGVTAAFQLRKAYTSGGVTYYRPIKKPVSGSILIAVAGVEKTITTHWTVDLTTGIITFTGGNIPSAAQAITAGFEFDVPARFDTDYLAINLTEFAHGQAPDIPIVEVRI